MELPHTSLLLRRLRGACPGPDGAELRRRAWRQLLRPALWLGLLALFCISWGRPADLAAWGWIAPPGYLSPWRVPWIMLAGVTLAFFFALLRLSEHTAGLIDGKASELPAWSVSPLPSWVWLLDFAASSLLRAGPSLLALLLVMSWTAQRRGEAFLDPLHGYGAEPLYFIGRLLCFVMLCICSTLALRGSALRGLLPPLLALAAALQIPAFYTRWYPDIVYMTIDFTAEHTLAWLPVVAGLSWLAIGACLVLANNLAHPALRLGCTLAALALSIGAGLRYGLASFMTQLGMNPHAPGLAGWLNFGKHANQGVFLEHSLRLSGLFPALSRPPVEEFAGIAGFDALEAFWRPGLPAAFLGLWLLAAAIWWTAALLCLEGARGRGLPRLAYLRRRASE